MTKTFCKNNKPPVLSTATLSSATPTWRKDTRTKMTFQMMTCWKETKGKSQQPDQQIQIMTGSRKSRLHRRTLVYIEVMLPKYLCNIIVCVGNRSRTCVLTINSWELENFQKEILKSVMINQSCQIQTVNLKVNIPKILYCKPVECKCNMKKVKGDAE